MTDNSLKLNMICGELTSYFLFLNAKNINLSISRTDDDNGLITISSSDLVLTPTQLEKTRIKLSNPRQPEVEGYYWGLIGGDNSECELRLVSAMTDLLKISSTPQDGTVIELKR